MPPHTSGGMRLSRTCYDKAHRCPGWAGGGMRSAAVDRCEGGRVKVAPRTRDYPLFVAGEFNDHPGAHPLRFGRCTSCGVITWPVATKYLDPSWLRFWAPRLVRDAVSELPHRVRKALSR